MRGTLQNEIKKRVTAEFEHQRKVHHWTKQRMAEELIMDERSYYDLEAGIYLCNMITFVLLIRLSGSSAAKFLLELIEIADKEFVLT